MLRASKGSVYDRVVDTFLVLKTLEEIYASVKPFWRKQERGLREGAAKLGQAEAQISNKKKGAFKTTLSAPRVRVPLGPIWSHVIMSVASSFDEARKRYGRYDFGFPSSSLLAPFAWGKSPSSSPFRASIPTPTFDSESNHFL